MKDLSNKNYYELLGVERTATEAEIKQAFKEISIVYHPDSNFFDEILPQEMKESDDEVFKAITEAYQTISHRDRRRVYDAELNKAELAKGINSTGEWIRPDGSNPIEKNQVRERTPTVTNLQRLHKQFENEELKNDGSGTYKRPNSLPLSAKVAAETMSMKDLMEEKSPFDNRFLFIIFGAGILLLLVLVILIFL